MPYKRSGVSKRRGSSLFLEMIESRWRLGLINCFIFTVVDIDGVTIMLNIQNYDQSRLSSGTGFSLGSQTFLVVAGHRDLLSRCLDLLINCSRDLLSRREAWQYQQSTDQAWPDTQAHNPAQAYSVSPLMRSNR